MQLGDGPRLAPVAGEVPEQVPDARKAERLGRPLRLLPAQLER
jgi:hypothetical protein